MVFRVALVSVFLLVLARPVHAQWEEEDLWTQPKKAAPAKKTQASSEGKFGLGIAVGAPTGLSGKMRLDKTTAVDAAFAWNDGAFYLHGDYLFAGKNKLVDGRTADVGWFVGLGARAVMVENAQSGATFVGMAAKKNGNGNGNTGGAIGSSSSSNVGLGARVPAGLSLRFDRARRIEAFGELALDVGIVNGDGTAIVGAIGGRWFF